MEIKDSYEVDFESTRIPIQIYRLPNEFISTYEVGILQVGEGTKYIVEKIKEDLLREGVLEKKLDDEGDYDYLSLKKLYISKVKNLLDHYFPNIDLNTKNKLVTYIVQKSLDLGFVDILIKDSRIEEITINGSTAFVMVYHKQYGWLKTNLSFLDDDQIKNIASRIALDNKKFFSNLSPLLDAHLLGGHRVNATMQPISTKGSTITIRRFSDTPWTIVDLIQTSTASPFLLALIWSAIENELSVLVSGGTGSGKTSFLNAISAFVPADQRIISVEDTREIRLPSYSHWVPMEARLPNQEGKGEVSMLDLIINSLRMRPDRIVIGEIRKKREAEVLFEAMRTGHSVYGTFHSNSATDAVKRLTNPPIDVPKLDLSALGLIVVLNRDRKTGRRVVFQIAEINSDGEESVILQYNKKTNQHFMKNHMSAILERLSEFQGITEQELYQDLEEKSFILDYLSKFNIRGIEEVGKVVNYYYQDKNGLLRIINSNLSKLRGNQN